MRKAAKEAIKQVNITEMQKKKAAAAMNQFKTNWKNAVKENVRPRWVKLSNKIPPEWYFNFVKGICELLYGPQSVEALVKFAKEKKWSFFRYKLNELPRKWIASILFYIFLKWIMNIQVRLRTFGIKNIIDHPEKGKVRQTIKFHGKVILEETVKYA